MNYAKDYPCSEHKCKNQAEVFFGMADPDCEQIPYCMLCVEKIKINIFRKLSVVGY